MFYIGLDLGQSQDYTAMCFLEEVKGEGEPDYHGRYLDRYALGSSYPAIVADMAEKLKHPDLKKAKLIVDKTGVGAPVVDMFRQAGLNPIPLTITGGNAITGNDSDGWSVPKRDLVSAAKVLLQSQRLKLAGSLRHTETLIDELINFKVKISTDGHDSYEAWREKDHDDLVLALCMAAWYATRKRWKTVGFLGFSIRPGADENKPILYF